VIAEAIPGLAHGDVLKVVFDSDAIDIE
jgi:hypothetical protein